MKCKFNKIPIFLCFGVIALLIFMRFGIFFLKSDGFNGLSMLLPALLLCVILSAFCASGFFAAWVYHDCKRSGDDPVLWAIVILIATPFIGLLIYFFRRPQIKKDCPACGHLISFQANFCEQCGIQVKNKEDKIMTLKKQPHHLSFLIAGIISMLLTLTFLTGFIVSAATGHGINKDVTSYDKIWNLGVINLNSNSCNDGIWKLDFKSASNGFVKENSMAITDADRQKLYADISCKTAPEGATLTLWLVQKNVAKSIDVTNLSSPLEYPLDSFENGSIKVRLQINGVKDTVCKISIL